ncbi:hypothetical protein KY327_03715 [Candidatus Woesearchaeota archaeon]|nr:hypothetical protein [Candidatus Woesearchaeota archaeon]
MRWPLLVLFTLLLTGCQGGGYDSVDEAKQAFLDALVSGDSAQVEGVIYGGRMPKDYWGEYGRKVDYKDVYVDLVETVDIKNASIINNGSFTIEGDFFFNVGLEGEAMDGWARFLVLRHRGSWKVFPLYLKVTRSSIPNLLLECDVHPIYDRVTVFFGKKDASGEVQRIPAPFRSSVSIERSGEIVCSGEPDFKEDKLVFDCPDGTFVGRSSKHELVSFRMSDGEDVVEKFFSFQIISDD